MGFAPGTGGVSLRTFNRNFEARSGTKDAGIYLVSPETAVASALSGYITDPQTLGDIKEIKLPDLFSINNNTIIPPEDAEKAKSLEVFRGPNIKDYPKTKPVCDSIAATITLKVGDNITTDHIMPAGAKILPYRSNIPYMSKFCFSVCDSEFPSRAEKAGESIILGGENYGQGSSREHAALVPLYLGVRAVVAKSFARIHAANLVNAGILPLTFAFPEDYNLLSEGDVIEISGIFSPSDNSGIKLTVKAKGIVIPLCAKLSNRQFSILKCGGLLKYTAKEKNHE